MHSIHGQMTGRAAWRWCYCVLSWGYTMVGEISVITGLNKGYERTPSRVAKICHTRSYAITGARAAIPRKFLQENGTCLTEVYDFKIAPFY